MLALIGLSGQSIRDGVVWTPETVLAALYKATKGKAQTAAKKAAAYLTRYDLTERERLGLALAALSTLNLYDANSFYTPAVKSDVLCAQRTLQRALEQLPR